MHLCNTPVCLHQPITTVAVSMQCLQCCPELVSLCATNLKCYQQYTVKAASHQKTCTHLRATCRQTAGLAGSCPVWRPPIRALTRGVLEGPTKAHCMRDASSLSLMASCWPTASSPSMQLHASDNSTIDLGGLAHAVMRYWCAASRQHIAMSHGITNYHTTSRVSVGSGHVRSHHIRYVHL